MGTLNNRTEKIYQFFWSAFFILLTCITIVPILSVISTSLSSKGAITAGKVLIYPVEVTMEAYQKVFQSGSFTRAFGYSIVLMLVTTGINLFITILAAYPLSKTNLPGGKVVMRLFVISMFLNPGIIPEYLNVKSFDMIDTVWALIIPGALSAYNMIIMRNAFSGIDSAIYDAAKIDGCSETKTLINIALPLVFPTIATLGLFYAVSRWNGITDVLYYINSTELYTVQMVLKQYIESITVSVEEGLTTNLVADNIKAASVVISMVPMLVVYPFVQKFFTQGIMVGSVKG